MNPEQFDWISMGMLGLLGTGHCIGMCGPLVFAFPGRTGQFAPHVWYHLGRITTYSVVGAVMGGIGQTVSLFYATDSVERIAGVQMLVAAAAALLLIAFGLVRMQLIREPAWLEALSPERIPGFRHVLQRASNEAGGPVFYALGLLLGFLPCGLSYAGFTRALTAGSAENGAFLLLCFAIGTVPGLLLLGTGFSKAFSAYRKQCDLIAGVLMIVMALTILSDAVSALG